MDGLSEPARLALAHIRARTVQGRFATGLYCMSDADWRAALHELEEAGYRISWTHGTVADEPTVCGGWILDAVEPAPRGPDQPPHGDDEESIRLARIAAPRPAALANRSTRPPVAVRVDVPGRSGPGRTTR